MWGALDCDWWTWEAASGGGVCVCVSEREREGGGCLTGVKLLGGLG